MHKNLYVQTLFNRLMFVYFISRKGWLEFEGSYEYLDAVWRDYEARWGSGQFLPNSTIRPCSSKA